MAENDVITDDKELRKYIDASLSVIELEEGYNITGSETFGWTVVVNGIGAWEILPSGLIIESR